MLDGDLAALYQVKTKVLKQAVKRNIERSPEDFMFELTKEEAECLRSQIVTLKILNLKSQFVTSTPLLLLQSIESNIFLEIVPYFF